MLVMYLTIFLLFRSIFSKQVYDATLCSAADFSAGSRYTCDTTPGRACDTFIVYRARNSYNTIPMIAELFTVDEAQLLLHNNLTNSSEILKKDREVIVPMHCACLDDGFFASHASFQVYRGNTYSGIACEAFEALVKTRTLAEENRIEEKDFKRNIKLNVPLRCACPDANDTRDGIQYLVTYPIMEFDDISLLANKFGIPPSDVFAANSIDSFSTVFPNTTVLVPLRTAPAINSTIAAYTTNGDDEPVFIPMIPTNGTTGRNPQREHISTIGYSVGFAFLFFTLCGFGFYWKNKYASRDDNLVAYSSARSNSTMSCLSPDLVAGMSKYSLVCYSIQDLAMASKGFSEENKLSASVHKGSIEGVDVVIKRVDFGDAYKTICIHSGIHHANIVQLEGVCYGRKEEHLHSYLVFEFARNGCLKSCLKNKPDMLPWQRRTQIALDVAVGLHYIHHCTVPSYIHMKLNSSNILISSEWRAKLGNLGAASVVVSEMERTEIPLAKDEWLAPEYVRSGFASPKVDVFAFGVVLFELLSGKEIEDGSFVEESLGFLRGNGSVTGCFDELREFMDPCVRDSPIGEALCLFVLAKSCVDDDPLHRPSMDGILKILARMVR